MIYTNQQFVRWDDIDAFGHVNNAKYLIFAQEARFQWSYYEFVKRNEKPTIVEMVVARAEVDYIEPIYDGGMEIDCQIWITRIGNSSFEMEYEIIHKGVIRARVKTTQVAVSVETKRSRPLTDEEREFLAEYLEEPK